MSLNRQPGISPWANLWLAVSGLALAVPASAAVQPIIPGQFSPSAVLTDFASAVDGTEVNGLSLAGYTFSYSLGNGQVTIGGGPGTTNNVDPPNIVTQGNPSGVFGIALSSPAVQFGFGFALLATGTIPAGTTISLFSGATNVGALSYTAVPDPEFPGGYAGINSTVAFDSVQLTFDSAAIAWAIDNFRVTAVPEPQTLALWLLGSLGLAGWMKARRRAG